MSYVYTPNDLAIFLLNANFKRSDEQLLLQDLWEEQTYILEEYRQDLSLFRREVHREIRREMTFFELEENMDELDLIMRDVDPAYVLLQPGYAEDRILQFFKMIRLQLLYIDGKDYRKIRLRRLLRYFGYKRRSAALVQNIKQALSILSLAPFLRGWVPCDIAALHIDDMVMIRLAQ